MKYKAMASAGSISAKDRLTEGSNSNRECESAAGNQGIPAQPTRVSVPGATLGKNNDALVVSSRRNHVFEGTGYQTGATGPLSCRSAEFASLRFTLSRNAQSSLICIPLEQRESFLPAEEIPNAFPVLVCCPTVELLLHFSYIQIRFPGSVATLD